MWIRLRCGGPRRPGCWLAVLLALHGLAPGPAQAQSGDNVLVVVNERSPVSVRIGLRYATTRKIPDDQLVRLDTSTGDEISRRDFQRDIQAPIAKWLVAHAAQDRILYIVLTSGTPLRVAGTVGRAGTRASVDSELTLLYRRMSGVAAPLTGSVPNPYFSGHGVIDQPKPFSHKEYDIYLVTRLDGFTERDVMGLIERGARPATAGQILLEGTLDPGDPRNHMLERAASQLMKGVQARTTLDLSGRVLQHTDNVLGYYGSGSNDPAMTGRQPELSFVPGAIAAMFLSTDARTFAEPPPDWKPARGDRRALYAGSSQSLIGDFIRSGVTGIAGQVAEPLLAGAVRPDILFPAYLSGSNIAEAFYQSIPFLSWQTVVVGDPLCAPFRTSGPSADELNPPLDPDTELPSWFSARRSAAIGERADPRSIKLLLRAEARLAQSDAAGARQALEQSVAIDPAFAAAWNGLASLHQQNGAYQQAGEAYRRVIALDPKDILALNNLAYQLAVYENRPGDALTLAERAARIAPADPRVNDTLGWIKHLLGDDREAVRLVGLAVRAMPDNVDIQLHTAAVYAAVGRLEEAARALQRARELDPAVKDRSEFREVEQKITGKVTRPPGF